MPRAALDFIAIGLGPFNLGLACLTAPIDGLDGLFIEKNEYFNWHPGMLLEDATLQTPFMGDLVTLADPTSPFSFLNYMKEQGRIYSFYIREDFFLVRQEFNAYCQWASDRLPNIRFNRIVERVEWEDAEKLYAVRTRCTRTGSRSVDRAPRLVLGTGTSPHIPQCCRGFAADISHTSSYLDEKATLQGKNSIAVVGSGQSAAEVFYDLLQDIDSAGYSLTWITRSPRFFPLELTKLTLEMTSPDYADYFFGLEAGKRDEVVDRQKCLYKGINVSLINDIYDTLYKKRLKGDIKVSLHTNTEMREVSLDRREGIFEVGLHQIEQDSGFSLRTEAIVLGTGYSYRVPEFLRPVADRIGWDDKGRFAVHRNYAIDKAGCEIFVQNAELHTHGFVAPDLGMAAYRNACIIRELLGRDHYPIETTVAFQSFAAPEPDPVAGANAGSTDSRARHA